MLVASERLLDESSALDESVRGKTLEPHYKQLTDEFLKELHELQALELYKAFYAGRLLQSLNTETATKN